MDPLQPLLLTPLPTVHSVFISFVGDELLMRCLRCDRMDLLALDQFL